MDDEVRNIKSEYRHEIWADGELAGFSRPVSGRSSC